MKYLLLPLLAITCWACNTNTAYKKAEDAQDAGRQFIRASLDGDVQKARFYLLKDSTNLYMLDHSWKQNTYDKLSTEERREYRDAQIRPVKIENENDSVVKYVFTNSYKQKDTTVINIVRINGEWLVDLKRIHRWNQ